MIHCEEGDGCTTHAGGKNADAGREMEARGWPLHEVLTLCSKFAVGSV
jgi:hypothetical protein